MVKLLVVDCKMRSVGVLYQCACKIAFRCGSTISTKSWHHYDDLDINNVESEVVVELPSLYNSCIQCQLCIGMNI